MQISTLTQNNYAQMDRMLGSQNNNMLLGPPGCGKSQIMEKYCKDRGYGYVELILSQVESVDIRGIMVPHRHQDGSQPDTVSTRTPLATMVERQIALGHRTGIIFFDEYYQAPHDVRKAVSQFLTARRIGDWNIPDGWVIWGASNPPDWRAGTVKPMGHETSRWSEIQLSPDRDGWDAWAQTVGIHHLYTTFAYRHPQEIFGTEPPKDMGKPHCNPRSFVSGHNFHIQGVVGNELPTDAITREYLDGTIGMGSATSLFGFLRVQDVMPSPEDMLNNPTTCKLPPPDRLDARYASMMQAVHYSAPDKNEALFEFVKRLDKEMAVSSIRHFCRKDPMSINAPNIAKFITDNPEAMMSIAA